MHSVHWLAALVSAVLVGANIVPISKEPLSGCFSAASERIPAWANGLGWTGADVGLSLQVRPSCALWVFGDTLLGTVRAAERQRVKNDSFMVHNSVALVPSIASGAGACSPHFTWSAGEPPGSAFHLPGLNGTSKRDAGAPHLWVLSGAVVHGAAPVVVLLANEWKAARTGGPFSFNITSTRALAVHLEEPLLSACDGGAASKMAHGEDWEYTVSDPAPGNWSVKLPNGTRVARFVNWATAVHEVPSDPASSFFILGTVGPGLATVAARLPRSGLVGGGWQGMQVFCDSVGWAPAQVQCTLQGLPFLGSTELVLEYVQGKWRTLAVLPFTTDIVQWTAPDITGPWRQQSLGKVWAPWSDTHLYFSYAAKVHASLAGVLPGCQGPACSVATLVPNTWLPQTLFDPGNATAYTPRMMQVWWEPA